VSSDLTIVRPTNGGLSITTSGCLEYQAALDMARAHLVDELAYYQAQLDALDRGEVTVWHGDLEIPSNLVPVPGEVTTSA
jgi:hypothetical protein